MAPEQINGARIDHRADLFAFGAVLYAMVTGHKEFEDKTQASLIVAILEREPVPMQLDEVETTSAAGLERTIRKLLAKDPEDRWQSARDLKHQLEWLAGGELEAAASSSVAPKRRWRIGVTAAIGAASVAAIIAITAYSLLLRAPPTTPVVRFSIALPEGAVFTTIETAGPTPQVAISPDGRVLAFAATQGQIGPVLSVRAIDSFTSQVLPGTKARRFRSGRPTAGEWDFSRRANSKSSMCIAEL